MNPDRRRVVLHTAAITVLGLSEFGSAALAAQPRNRDVDVHIELRAMQDRVAIRPGDTTAVWRFEGRLLHGAPESLQPSAGGYLGPIIRVRRGQRVRIDLLNDLPESTIIHWHGLHVPADMDGHPRHAIAPGERYVYEFTVLNRAGTYWFHPHPHGRTGKQVYQGLAGLFLVTDDEEAALDLPGGLHDIPLVIQDRNFGDDNQLVYPAQGASRGMMGGGMMGRGMMGGGRGGMMARMMGVLGDEILVNGRPRTKLAVDRRPYRLRLLNASNTRTYKLAWSDGSPLTVIGTDGGLLAAPLQRDFVMLAPAERIDLWIDFAQWPGGSDLALHSLAFEGGMGMGGMMMGGSSLPDGSPFQLLGLEIRGSPKRGRATQPPQRLSQIAPAQTRIAVNAERPKVFELTMGMMTWGINGASFDMLEASPEETVKLGTHEVWEFRNEGRGAMMDMVMAHSMHIHGLQFRVIGREVSSRFAAAYGTVKGGLVDDGWKDTVLVMPGERVRVLVGFEDYAGLFLYHCHMLEHEDSGLMRNYLVET